MTPPAKSLPGRPAPCCPAVRLAVFFRRASLLLSLPALILLSLVPPAHAQLSFSSAVSLALSSSPKVRMAELDLARARSVLAQAHDVYVPAIQGSGQIGYNYGPPLGEPTLFSFNASSLAFSFAQRDYIRSAHFGLDSAAFALAQVRQEVAEDAAVTYLSLDHDQQRHAAMLQQYGYATHLADITQQRFDVGQDTEIEVARAKRAGLQIALQLVQLDDDIDTLRRHLAVIDGVPDGPITTLPDTIPPLPDPPRYDPNHPYSPASPPAASTTSGRASSGIVPADNPGLAAAFASARARQEQAFGDARFLYRPQISFFGAYSRFSTFNNYQTYYPQFSNHTLNAIAAGVQITIPFYDRARSERARESATTAAHAFQEAINDRDIFFEGRVKLEHSTTEVALQAELADVNQKIAQQELEDVVIQMNLGNGNINGRQVNPKDQSYSQIEERRLFLEAIDAKFHLREAQIRLLRQTGQLDTWLKSTLHPTPASPAPPTPPSP